MTNIIIQPEVIKTLADCVVDIIQNKIEWQSIDWQAVAEKAIERPQGEWIYGKDEIWRCSKCHKGYANQPIYMGKPVFKYCPRCGADMRKEAENGNNDNR